MDRRNFIGSLIGLGASFLLGANDSEKPYNVVSFTVKGLDARDRVSFGTYTLDKPDEIRWLASTEAPSISSSEIKVLIPKDISLPSEAVVRVRRSTSSGIKKFEAKPTIG